MRTLAAFLGIERSSVTFKPFHPRNAGRLFLNESLRDATGQNAPSDAKMHRSLYGCYVEKN